VQPRGGNSQLRTKVGAHVGSLKIQGFAIQADLHFEPSRSHWFKAKIKHQVDLYA
jgi:hypothetical protein